MKGLAVFGPVLIALIAQVQADDSCPVIFDYASSECEALVLYEDAEAAEFFKCKNALDKLNDCLEKGKVEPTSDQLDWLEEVVKELDNFNQRKGIIDGPVSSIFFIKNSFKKRAK